MDKREYVLFNYSWIITVAKPFCSAVTISLSYIHTMDKRKSLALSPVRLV